ncbi:MAG: NADH-ubiquinone oxidoreductase-F iron-sulfur binding region domain-containing protein [Dehalococcoidia bacterium]|nr:NADH-ubiquinone oxidoreductase-F iron-sulfur binding region domain-containing protein [Dehalococcoidia bacterium]
MKRLSSLKELAGLRQSIATVRDTKKQVVNICGGTGCIALGANDVIKAFNEEIAARGLQDKVDVRVSGCPGFCERGSILTIEPQNIFYQRVRRKDVAELVQATLIDGKTVERLLYPDLTTGKKVIREAEVPFYTKQKRVLLAHSSRIDPQSIEDYLYFGGYAALSKALSAMKPEHIIDEMKASGLRGRGGGGFPTGRKWETTRHAHGDIKYVICNCDEGDPGAFMDRSLMEGNPHSVLEGMIIGAYAIGAHEGYIYVRNEYPLAVKNARIAIEQAEEYGLLGDNILGSGFNFHVKISRGGGAFVCGESTALMASLEGEVGEPRAKYVHTSEKGLWDRPSNLNNVETWANVPQIINNGAKWFAGIGTAGSKGTKIFSLVGKVRNTGLVEVPMGITLREIIFDIGGGIPGNKKFKAVQTGGPSGGFIPENLLDLQVDFDELTRVGSMMGSGAMIVMDESNCMVDMAKYFVTFLMGELCGKCLPCREGMKQLHYLLTRVTGGLGTIEDIALIESLCSTMWDTSLCGLGYSAPNPVMTSLKYFREEWDAHIDEKRCPAKVCKPLITYNIMANCPNCGLCVKACPVQAITPRGKKEPVVLDQVKCTRCGSCFDVCRLDAVLVK